MVYFWLVALWVMMIPEGAFARFVWQCWVLRKYSDSARYWSMIGLLFCTSSVAAITVELLRYATQ